MSLQTNYSNILSQVEAAAKRVNRNPEDIEIVAVTKYVSNETAQKAVDIGIKNLGENRLEGFLEKHEAITDEDVTWHFIGTLQSRKVRDLINDVDYLHSLDRKSLAKEINKRADQKVRCFVQVNVSGEESKHGLNKEEVIPFIESLQQYEKIEVVGLMTMAPLTDDETIVRQCFKDLRMLKEQIEQMNLPYAPCQYLSMGMSQDFEIAIEEGATHIRIGTSLVGNEYN